MLVFRRYIHAITIAAAIAGATPLPALAQDADMIVMKNFDYSPMTLTVKAGTTVTWKNLDGEPHTIVSLDGAFRSGALDQDDTFSHKFDKPGTYKYICSVHPKMRAEIVVQ